MVLSTYALFLMALMTLTSALIHPRISNKCRLFIQPNMAVSEVVSTSDLDNLVKESGDKLIVIDYSTTWCGPCKLVLPKYVELSEKYPDVTFLKCIGDASTEASALMKREGVRSVPSFHLWKAGNKVDTINGAKIEDVEAAVKSNL